MSRPARAACVVLALASVAVAQTAPTSRSFSRHVQGTIEQVEEGAIVVRRLRPRAGVEPTTRVVVDEHVVLRMDGRPAELEQIQPGMSVVVQSVVDKVYVVVTSSELGGRVIRVDGTTLVIRVTGGERAGQEVHIETDEQTGIAFTGVGRDLRPRAATLAELSEGTAVLVVPSTGMAKRIIAYPPDDAATTRP